MTTLDSLRDRLAAVLAGLDETQSLTIARTGSMDFVSEEGSNRFVQFALFGTELRAESVGDRYLSGVDQLTPDQNAVLAELGWSPPDESGNYWTAWDDPVPYDAVAVMALATLASVHGVEHAEQLSFSGSPGVLEMFAAAPTLGTSSDGAARDQQMQPRTVRYWDYDPDEEVTCARCGWTGRAGDYQEQHQALLEVRCAECDRWLIGVLPASLGATREAAAAGNPRAMAELADMEEEARRRKARMATLLAAPEQLPDLSGDDLVIEWDLTDEDGEGVQVLRHEGEVIWREAGFYESYKRFEEVFEILQQRYGERFRELRPTRHSEVWLYGDRLSAPHVVDALNKSLQR